MEHLAFRLHQQNYSSDEISKMAGLDKEFLEMTVAAGKNRIEKLVEQQRIMGDRYSNS